MTSSIYDIHGSLRRALQEDAMRESNARVQKAVENGRRLVAEIRKLREEETILDAKLAKHTPWSEKWWHYLHQINGVRRDRLAGIEVLKELAKC